MAATPAKQDGRKELGDRTCQRLLEATLELLSERGGEALTLREITDAAGANVAAVSYHFGSKEALIKRAVEYAIDSIIDAQAAELDALGARPCVDALAGALARPVAEAVTAGADALAVHRIIARVSIDPPPGCRERLSAQLQRRREQLRAACAHALPDLDARTLAFRVDSAIGLLDWLVLRGPGEIAGEDAAELERLLVPMLVGALSGAQAPAPATP
jgi:AcrR family transcriptional regulator